MYFIRFRFVDLPRRENGDCKRDYIEIYDGIASWTRVKEICGNESIYQPIISKSYKMKVKFTADRVHGKNRGFEAMYDPYQPSRGESRPSQSKGRTIRKVMGGGGIF
jgi:hypothetical protein